MHSRQLAVGAGGPLIRSKEDSRLVTVELRIHICGTKAADVSRFEGVLRTALLRAGDLGTAGVEWGWIVK